MLYALCIEVKRPNGSKPQSLMSKNLFGEKNSHLTCQTQSRNKINVGALLFDLDGTESLNGPLNVLDQKGCPA